MPARSNPDPAPDPRRYADAGSRLAGLAAICVGSMSIALSSIIGMATLAATEGTTRAAGLMFSVAALTGQIGPASASDRVPIMILTFWMASGYLVLAIGLAVLWNVRTVRRHRRTDA